MNFGQAVEKVVREIPKGKVVSYGQVAAYVGVPSGARQVGWRLRQNRSRDLPWWRVVNNSGRISIRDNWEHDAIEQRELLRKERVKVGEDFNLEIDKYRFRPDLKLLKTWLLDEVYRLRVYEKFKSGY